MQKIKNLIFQNQYFLTGFLIICIPFLEYLNVNFNTLDNLMFESFLAYFLFGSIIYIFFILIIKTTINDKLLRDKIIITSTIFFWLLFQFEYIQNFLFKVGINEMSKDNLSAELSIIIISALSLIFLSSKILKFISKFLIIFFIAQHIFVYSGLLTNFYFNHKSNSKEISKILETEKNFFTNKEIDLINKNKNKNLNIYYLVIDEMTSLNQYKKLGGQLNVEEWIKNFGKYGYRYVSNTYSTFNDTNTTFGSIFNLKPIITENFNLSNDLYNDLTYPTSLSKDRFILKQYPKLIKNLKKLNYEFKWIGNSKYNCQIYNRSLCLEYNDKLKDKNDFSLKKFLNLYVLKTFLENTPLEEIFRIYYKNKSINDNAKLSNNIIDDDAIEKFILNVKKYNKKDQLYFYFLHDQIIKEPYPFDSNCKKIEFKNINNEVNLNIQGYLNIYGCALKKINKLISFLDEYDPNSIVIIQSDHGFRAPYKDYKDLRRYEIFSLIKINKECDDIISDQIDNVNSARLALSCATFTKPKIIEKKTYFTNKRKVRDSIIIEIKSK
ncbi:hypothetical protein IDG58_04760 [Pelagibacterales bacterium SAG-MED19]|nr:hypothetical protein [Pelagibacterales bacterium SAG-MED19]